MMRLVGLALGLGLAALIVLGFDFLLISQGLLAALFFAAPYWLPAQAILARLAGFAHDSAHFLPPQGAAALLLRAFQLGLAFALLGVGAWDLLERGFAGQNLFFLLAGV